MRSVAIFMFPFPNTSLSDTVLKTCQIACMFSLLSMSLAVVAGKESCDSFLIWEGISQSSSLCVDMTLVTLNFCYILQLSGSFKITKIPVVLAVSPE